LSGADALQYSVTIETPASDPRSGAGGVRFYRVANLLSVGQQSTATAEISNNVQSVASSSRTAAANILDLNRE